MKLLFFDDFKLGVLNGDTVVDVSQAVQDIPHTGPQWMLRARQRKELNSYEQFDAIL